MTGADRVAQWALVPACLFLFVLPVTHTVAIRTIALGLFALSAGYLWWRERPPKPSRGLRIAMIAWAGAAAATLAWTIDFEYSQGEFRNEIVYTLAAFLAFYALTPDEERWRLWVRVLTVSAAVIAVYAFVNYFRHADWYTRAYVGDRNAYSTYATLVAPVLLAGVLDRGFGAGWRIAGGSALALTLGGGALTQNRIMWLALLTAAVVLLAARFRWRAADARTRAAVLAAVLALGAVGGTQLAVVSGQKSLAGAAAPLASQIESDPRVKIWAYSAERIGERPWLGYGYGRGILRKDFRARFEGNLLNWHGHNLFLNTAMGGGAVLVAALVALLATLAVALGREAREVRPCAIALAVLAAGIVKSLTDDVLIRENSLLLWSVAGMALGTAARADAPGARESGEQAA
jgi:O-antigen ligase